MKAGKLRHRLTLQSPVDTQNTWGEQVQSFSTSATVFGGIEPVNARELMQADKVESEVTHEVTIRYPATIPTAEWRVVFGTRTFEVLSVICPFERKHELQLLCKETT